MNAPKMPRLPVEKRQELIGALLDRFLPQILMRRTKPAGSAEACDSRCPPQNDRQATSI